MNLITIDSTEVLIAKINSAHKEAQQYAAKAVERALEAGDLLLLAKSQVAHGQWLPWLQKNCPDISERTAQNYMKVAKGLPIEKRNAADLTMREALRLVASEPEEPEQQSIDNFVLPWLRSSDPISVAATVRQWHDLMFAATAYMDTAGMSIKEIAKTLNIHEEEIEPFVNTNIPYMDFSGVIPENNKEDKEETKKRESAFIKDVINHANRMIEAHKTKAYDTALYWSKRMNNKELTEDLRAIHRIHERKYKLMYDHLGFPTPTVEWIIGKYLSNCALGLEYFDKRGFIAMHRAVLCIICTYDYTILDSKYGFADIWLGKDKSENIPLIPNDQVKEYFNRTDEVLSLLKIPYKELGTATLDELKAEKKRIWDNEQAIFHGDSSMLRLAA